jgi:hypothetical protein
LERQYNNTSIYILLYRKIWKNIIKKLSIIAILSNLKIVLYSLWLASCYSIHGFVKKFKQIEKWEKKEKKGRTNKKENELEILGFMILLHQKIVFLGIWAKKVTSALFYLQLCFLNIGILSSFTFQFSIFNILLNTIHHWR